jgi:ketosteroid isomerase-like protein
MVSLTRAIGRADPDAAGRCFGEDARLVTPGATSRGRRAIGRALALLFAPGSRIDVRESSLQSGHGIAVGSERWRIRTLGGAAGPPRGLEATVVLREIDGAWKLVLATLFPGPHAEL